MVSLKETSLKTEVLKEFNYDFGTVFVFDGFVVSEINEGVIFTYDTHAQLIVEDVSTFLNTTGEDIIYISHRIHSYSVMPSDWLKFFKNSYSLKGYVVVGYTHGSVLNTVIENLFFTKTIKRFHDLETAVHWASQRVFVEMD